MINFPVDTVSVSNNAFVLTEKFSGMFCIMSCKCLISRTFISWFFAILMIKNKELHYYSNLFS